MLRVAENILDLVGSTPLLRLRRLPSPGAAQLWAKLEYLNPGGSVKDRAALGIVAEAEASGKLRPGMTIVEATAGNTGVGLAFAGINHGYAVTLYVPEGFAQEKITLMRAFGATVVLTPDAEGIRGAIAQAEAHRLRAPETTFPAFQFTNQANPRFHEQTTGPELWEQMEGCIDAWVAGVGTGGTFSGVARFLKSMNPTILTVAVETEGSVLQGGEPGRHQVEGIGVSFIPATFHPEVADRIVRVTDRDAFRTVRELAREEGVLAGSSAGASVFAALELARELGEGKRVATLIADSAERYLSKHIFEQFADRDGEHTQ